MNDFFRFMATRWGRLTRFSVGLLLFAWGAGTMGFFGMFAAFLGAIAMFTGLTDLCITAAFFNLPITGKMLRRHYGIQEQKLDFER